MLVQKLLHVAQVGSLIVFYLLIALSVLSIAVIIDRWRYFRSRRIDPTQLKKELLAKLRSDDRKGALSFLEQQRGVEAQVLAEALRWYEHGFAAVEQILQTGARERRRDYESGLLFLGTLGNNAPFIGLFGTVLGVVTAFRELGGNAAGAMGNVMTGIAEALIATGIGILVALPAVVAYNVFQKKSSDLEENVATLGGLLLAQMKSQLVTASGAASNAGAAEAKA